MEAATNINKFKEDHPLTYQEYGADHTESILLQYGAVILYKDQLGLSEEDVIVSKEMVRHQMNYAKTGYFNKVYLFPSVLITLCIGHTLIKTPNFMNISYFHFNHTFYIFCFKKP